MEVRTLDKRKVPESPVEAPSRNRLLAKLGTYLLPVAAAFGLSTANAEPAKTQDTRPKTLNGTLVAQARTDGGGTPKVKREIPEVYVDVTDSFDVSKMPKVTSDEIIGLDRKVVDNSEDRDLPIRRRMILEYDHFTCTAYVNYNGTGLAAHAFIYYKAYTHPDGSVTPAGDTTLGVAVNGKLIAGIDLNKIVVSTATVGDKIIKQTVSLPKLYKKLTGKEMKFVKLVADIGTDNEHKYSVGISVCPVEQPNGEIKGELPAYGANFYPTTLNVFPDGSTRITTAKSLMWITR